MSIRKRKTDSNTEVEVEKVETERDLQGFEGEKDAERREEVQEVVGNEPIDKETDPNLSPATRAGVTDPVGREEFRKATELTNNEKVSEAEAEKEEERKVESKADTEQYGSRLAELEAASTDMRRSYNERFSARAEADVLRAVMADMDGEGSETSTTLPEGERKVAERIDTLVNQEPTTRG